MIKTGDLVTMRRYDYCRLSLGLRSSILFDKYPPENSLCLVVTGIREKDLSHHSIRYNAGQKIIELKKAIQVAHDGRIYGPCDLMAFHPVKQK